MRRLARSCQRLRWYLLATFVVLFALAAWAGSGVSKRLVLGGFEDPASESARAEALLEEIFALGEPDVVLLFPARPGGATGAALAEDVERVLRRFRGRPGVLHVSSPVGVRPDALQSADGQLIVATLQLRGPETAKQHRYQALAPELRRSWPKLLVGGTIPAGLAAEQAASRDLGRAEWITLPLLALALVWVFRGLVAALLSMLVGGFAILGALAGLRLLTHATEISIFAMNIVTFIGLGLAVDYSLFVVSRFREELVEDVDVAEALANTLPTAGRTVLVSGLAVMVSLLGLLVFPLLLLRSVALGGALVVLLTLIASLVFLPALLSVTGRWVNRLALGRPRASVPGGGIWHRTAAVVMKAPTLVVVLVATGLITLGVPFLRIETAISDSRILPADAEVRRVQEILERPGLFPPNELTPIMLMVKTRWPVTSREGVGALYDYVQQIQAIPGIRRVDSIVSVGPEMPKQVLQQVLPAIARSQVATELGLHRGVKGRRTVVAVFSRHGPLSATARTQLEAIRGIRVAGISAMATGDTARLVDLRRSLKSRVPLALGIVCAATFIALLLAFGSLVLPVKAIVVNALALSAGFGALVYIFQDGRLETLLQFQSPGYIELTIPVVMFAVLFGLSMDYLLFLLSRIREEYDRTGDARKAVVVGMERSGRLVTGAAAVLVVVMLGFSVAEMVLIKELGVGMAVAIVLDATVVGMLLIPAVMGLLGRAAWWAPSPVRRLWERLGLRISE